MIPIKASEFHSVILDKIEKDMPWVPFKYMTIRWMRNHVTDPASFGFFDDMTNFAAMTSVKRGDAIVQQLDIRATLLAWIASFQQSIPWFLNLLKTIETFLINNLPQIIALILAIIPKGSNIEVVDPPRIVIK